MGNCNGVNQFSDFADGQPKLLNIWASWCLPCIAEAPHLERLQQSGAEIVGVAIRDRPEDVARFLATTPPDTVLMTDVPKLLAVLSGRRCVPFVYRAEPPDVLVGDADLVFYTRELPQAAAVMDAVAHRFEPAFELPAVDEGAGAVRPTVYRVRQ